VVQWAMMGEPEARRAGIDSNVISFVLRPVVSGVTASPGAEAGVSELSLNVSPAVGIDQRVALLLNEFDPPSSRPARSYRFDVDVEPAHPGDTAVTPLVIPVKDVASGSYLVRLQVDGAESPLDVDSDPGNPRYATPRVDIP